MPPVLSYNKQREKEYSNLSLVSQNWALFLCILRRHLNQNNMMKIREVSKDSVVRDFNALSRIAASPYCSYICIDTEFPGFIRNTPSYASVEQRYRHVKFNVDKLKIIQLGFTFYT